MAAAFQVDGPLRALCAWPASTVDGRSSDFIACPAAESEASVLRFDHGGSEVTTPQIASLDRDGNAPSRVWSLATPTRSRVSRALLLVEQAVSSGDGASAAATPRTLRVVRLPEGDGSQPAEAVTAGDLASSALGMSHPTIVAACFAGMGELPSVVACSERELAVFDASQSSVTPIASAAFPRTVSCVAPLRSGVEETVDSLVCAGGEGGAFVWDFREDSRGPAIDLPLARANTVQAVSSFASGEVVTGSNDGVLRLWDPRMPSAPRRAIVSHSHWVMSVDCRPQAGSLLAISGASDGTVALADFAESNSDETATTIPRPDHLPERSAGNHEDPVRAVAWSCSGDAAASASFSGEVIVQTTSALFGES
jgi:WD40 repeat protein